MENDPGTIEISSDTPDGSSPPARPGLIRRTFRNRFGHWRAGWRIVVYAVAVFVVSKAVAAPLKLLFPDAPESDFLSWTHTLVWVVGNLALLLGGLGVLKFLDRRPPALLGLGFSRGWLRELSIGLLAGPAVTGFLVCVLIISGSVSLEFTEDLRASLGALPFYVVLFTLAAAVEEFLFRGYPLQALAEGSRPWIAGLLLSILFTMGHADNPDVTTVGIANIFLASVILVILYFQTRRLWLPIAFHLSWNFAQSWLWGFDVSGIKITDQLFKVTPNGSDLLTGGEFGLEGSVLSTLLFVTVVVWFLVRPILRPTAEVAALWAPYPAGFGLDPAHPPDAGYSMLDTRSARPPGSDTKPGRVDEERSSIENRESSI